MKHQDRLRLTGMAARPWLMILCLLSGTALSIAQTARQAAVELTATIGPDRDRITLQWNPDPQATAHFVFRKFQNANDWGTVLKALPGGATEFTDSTLLPGLAYEYRVLRQGSGYDGFGYLSSGIDLPHRAFQGKIILLVDSTMLEPLFSEIERLVRDLEGDGWEVIRMTAGRNESPEVVRSRIIPVWTADKLNTRALLLLGHIPVPYSGDLFPDGHPDHEGAWPADGYYGEMNGNWTDVSVNVIVATDARNDNVPGDGKFDQSVLPSDLELQVGRIDLSNLPAFAAPETELLRAYLDKDHAYRHNQVTVDRRAIIDDNFGYFSGEAFAASAWKNFSPLVGTANVTAEDYFTSLNNGSALWSYGCGGGWYQGAGGIGNTDQFATSNTQSVFTMLFGSYFGDWDVTNSFLRAPLAQGLTLTNAWSGRPHWQFHRMGMGETIGHCARMTQNNSGSLYFASYGARFVHLALMGDPTLRNDMITPVPVVTAEPEGFGARITWSPSPDATDGYLVYMRPFGAASYELLTEEAVPDSLWTIECLDSTGCYEVMVRARALTTTPSGSFYNLSQGVTGLFCQTVSPDVIADASFEVDESTVAFSNQSVNADTWLWIFGDGTTSLEENPVHTYLDGDFTATLVASNACASDTVSFDFTVFTSVSDGLAAPVRIYPNPASGFVWIESEAVFTQPVHADLFSPDGRPVSRVDFPGGRTALPLSGLSPGTYLLVLSGQAVLKRVVLVVQ